MYNYRQQYVWDVGQKQDNIWFLLVVPSIIQVQQFPSLMELLQNIGAFYVHKAWSYKLQVVWDSKKTKLVIAPQCPHTSYPFHIFQTITSSTLVLPLSPLFLYPSFFSICLSVVCCSCTYTEQREVLLCRLFKMLLDPLFPPSLRVSVSLLSRLVCSSSWALF